LSFDGRSFDDHFLICDIRADLGSWAHERRFYFDPEWNPGRQVLIHPCPGSTYRIDWQVPPDYDLADEERSGALDRRIRRILGDRDYEIVWQSVYRFHSRVVDRMRARRVLVAGDLAHLFAPFGARGLNSGVQDVENAAWKLAFVLHGWTTDALLESYHDERLAAALENLEITAATMRFLVPHSDAEWTWRRTVLDRAVHEPEARGLVDSGRLAEPFWYVDSPLTTADPSRPFPGRPPKGSAPPVVPGVLVPDLPVHLPNRADVTRLREIVRDGVLVLTTRSVDTATVAAAVKEVTSAPAQVLALTDIDVERCADDTLGTRPGEAWVIRPDGHLAAIVSEPTRETVQSAVRRTLSL